MTSDGVHGTEHSLDHKQRSLRVCPLPWRVDRQLGSWSQNNLQVETVDREQGVGAFSLIAEQDR